ncbi:putative nuclease HARBI1 [Ischnura elegans]|uniref:putative nuclease HARBI1 n=1 Tax=Ischnura elegans TaxID=197161 RepID=UPI001ED8A52B|nr:putative nuclease HARBI1 [Ischnura elegans]
MKTKFFNVAGFPSVIGCIDGRHIPIQSPGGDNAELFRNRKGYFSINVQVVCDADLKLINIVSRWPGSTHDSTIFNASFVRAQLEAKELGSGYLLGDSAYPCRPYLMTPVANPATAAEHRYNSSHIKTRNIAERAIGVWKRRFPCLSLGLRTTINTTLSVIVATAILNNLAIIPDDHIDDVDDFGEAEDQAIEENPNALGNAVRNTIIDTYFN